MSEFVPPLKNHDYREEGIFQFFPVYRQCSGGEVSPRLRDDSALGPLKAEREPCSKHITRPHYSWRHLLQPPTARHLKIFFTAKSAGHAKKTSRLLSSLFLGALRDLGGSKRFDFRVDETHTCRSCNNNPGLVSLMFWGKMAD
jgi:hypothetical protein